MAEVPHFALPFRYANGRPVVVEQDTPEEVAACVEAILRTEPGERPDLPAFGAPDLTFSSTPLDLDVLAQAVETWEPRARFLLEEAPDTLDAAVRRVRLTLDTEARNA